MLATDMKPPLGISTEFNGQAQDFKDLMANMLIALGSILGSSLRSHQAIQERIACRCYSEDGTRKLQRQEDV